MLHYTADIKLSWVFLHMCNVQYQQTLHKVVLVVLLVLDQFEVLLNQARQIYNTYKYILPPSVASVGRAPEAYGSCRVCLSICLYFQVTFLHNAWKLSAETCFANTTCNSLERDFRFKALLLTYDVMRSPRREPRRLLPAIEEQISHNRLLINMTVQSIQQIRRWLEWNLVNKTAKATKPKFPTSAYHGPRAIEDVT